MGSGGAAPGVDSRVAPCNLPAPPGRLEPAGRGTGGRVQFVDARAGAGRRRRRIIVVRGAAVVTKLVDGDTLDVRLGGGGVERIRLIGIDTPVISEE